MLTHQRRAPSSHHFQHTRTTRAPTEALAHEWASVATWPTWDDALAWAALDGPYRAGARGRLKAHGSPPSTFEVAEHGPTRTVIVSHLPLGRLRIDRRVEPGTPSSFTHEVSFEGIGGWLLGWFLGPRFARALPRAMDALAARAEAGR